MSVFVKEYLELSIDPFMPMDTTVLIVDNINYKVTQGKKAGTVMWWTLTAHGVINSLELNDIYFLSQQGYKKNG